MDMDQDDFDLEGYSANYNGYGKIHRLMHIVRTAPNGSRLELEALRLLVDALKQTYNTASYTDATTMIGGRLGPKYDFDSAWVQQTDSRAASKSEALERELNGFKTNLMKEAIRVGQTDLADHFYSRGDLQSAFKCYLRTRDYCSTSKHILSMCLNVVRINIALGNYINVSNYVQKAEATPDIAKDPVLASKFRCAGALALIDSKKYQLAARKLTEVAAEMGNQFSEAMAAQDVAIYGGLCALASFDRSELRRHVIDNMAFHEYLELCPEVREVVADFYGARYSACLQRLARLVPHLRLDAILGPHINHLHDAIRSKAIVQYTRPFQSVHLPTMAAAFGTDSTVLERELAYLIQKGDVAARIDSHNKVLYARHANQRAATFSAVLKAGQEYLDNTSAALLRASLLKHDLVQRHGAAGFTSTNTISGTHPNIPPANDQGPAFRFFPPGPAPPLATGNGQMETL
ncbi:hypothetical protein WJX73_009012 [Symbiochloris irregularis]|uniref:PCI domain-containing protein n=1 Tax=Symbiochloris irregularis TaxID=706552 RepID=A0AAW1NW73_9CHLO